MRRVLPFQLIFLPFLKLCLAKDELDAELRRHNAHVSGEGAGGGLLFDDVMENFVTCTDEACLLATTKSAASSRAAKVLSWRCSLSNNVYPLLPLLWHAMLRSEKRDEGYTLKCLHELYFEAHVLYPEMQKLRLCVSAALENLHHLDLGVPANDPGGNVAPELSTAHHVS